MGPIRRVEGGCEVRVWVVAGGSKDEVVGIHGDRIKVKVAAAAEKGRANRAVEALISQELRRPAVIVSGTTTRAKTVFVPGSKPESIVRDLGV